MLITAAFLCAGNNTFAQTKVDCERKLTEANTKMTGFQNARRKLNDAIAIQDRSKSGTVSALDLKKCIFWAYDSTPYLANPPGYTTEPTENTATQPEHIALKMRCEHAVSVANEKAKPTDNLITNASTQLENARTQHASMKTSITQSKISQCITSAQLSINTFNITIPQADLDTATSARASLEEKITRAQQEALQQQQDSAQIDTYYKNVINRYSNDKDKKGFKESIGKIPADKREKLVTLLNLVVKNRGNSRRDSLGGNISIITLIEKIESKQLGRLDGITESANRLLTDSMGTVAAYEIVNGIMDLSENTRVEIVNALVEFIQSVPAEKKDAYTHCILSSNLRIMKNYWADIFEKANTFITDSMDNKATTSIINLIKDIQADKRDAIFTAIKQITHTASGALRASATSSLISEVNTMAKKKTAEEWTELMSKITDRLTDELTLPQVVEIMKNPDTASDAVSDTVRDRGA